MVNEKIIKKFQTIHLILLQSSPASTTIPSDPGHTKSNHTFYNSTTFNSEQVYLTSYQFSVLSIFSFSITLTLYRLKVTTFKISKLQKPQIQV